MRQQFRKISDIDLAGKKVLLRVAYDIGLVEHDGVWVADDEMRIRATVPTIEYLLGQGCSLGVVSWLKRPGGKVVPKYSLAPVAKKLSEIINRPVEILPNCVGVEVSTRVASLKPGEVIMLENVRFHPEEEIADPNFARELTKGFDVIVYDAFAQSHRVHASTTGILEYLPVAAGLLFEKEIEYLSDLLTTPASPFVAVLGGAKMSDRIDVMQNLIKKADVILIGGAIANTFLAAQGRGVGDSLIEDVYVNSALGEEKNYQEIARELISRGENKVNIGDLEISKLQLPIDMVAGLVADRAQTRVVDVDKGQDLEAGWAYYDIGPRARDLYANVIKSAKTVFANGPMGLFEEDAFAVGTKTIGEAIISSGAVSVIGGGDTETIVTRWGWDNKFSHVSTGGGAALEFLAGKEFPVMKYLLKENVYEQTT